MDVVVDSKIVVVRGGNDILNSGYLSPIRDDKSEFPSVDHYAYCQILLQAGFVGEARDSLAIPNARECGKFVRNIILTRFRDGGQADHYLSNIRDEYLCKGLRLRLNQDSSFRRALMDTGKALLVQCDADDLQYGVGMDERTFLRWVESECLTADVLLDCFRRYETCPFKGTIGKNKLGMMLLEIRAEEFDRMRKSPQPPPLATVMSMPPPSSVPLASSHGPPKGPLPSLVRPQAPADVPASFKQLTDAEIEELVYQRYVISGSEEGDDDWIVSDQILSLEGPFAVLSQYYPTPFTTWRHRYRSVEHYAYQKLFRRLKLGQKAMEKLITTPDPSKLSYVARRVLDDVQKKRQDSRLEEKNAATRSKRETTEGAAGSSSTKEAIDLDVTNFYDRLLEFYERATKAKFEQYPVLKRLLVSTGDALLVETCPTTDHGAACEWTIYAQELDIQRFLATSPYNAGDLLRFLLKPDATLFRYFPGAIGRNRAGLALMRLRREYCKANVEGLHIPPPPPPTGGELDENQMICFTNTSIFHPDYVAPFWTKEGELFSSVQHFIILDAAKKFGFSSSMQRQLAQSDASELVSLFMDFVYQRFPHPEQYLEWVWTGGRDETLKVGSRLKFEKHPDLLRALLETGNASLVHCRSKFESEDTEWSVASTEQELKQWMQDCRLDVHTLLKLCSSPLERRPAFLGGNRLGALLMELRREFRLRGFQAHTLPKLNLPVDVVLGTGDESETNDDPDDDFYTDDVWPSPYFLLSKKRGMPVLDRPNKRRKCNKYSSTSLVFPSLPNPTPGTVVAMMDIDQLKQSAAMLVSKLAAMRKETEWEAEALRQLLSDLSEIRDRVPDIEESAAQPSEDIKPEPTGSIQTASALDQKEKWFSFESGLLSVLQGAILKIKEEENDSVAEEKSLLDIRSWDEPRIRSLVDRVWPHLTLRERQTASEWLLYTTSKLETMRRKQNTHGNEANNSQSPFGHSGKDLLIPREKSETKWTMPLMKVIMTQKATESNEGGIGARSGTPQGEGTTLDSMAYGVDWTIPVTGGSYPKLLEPITGTSV